MKAAEFFTFPGIRRRLYIGPLGPYVDRFAKQLQETGYARKTIRFKLRTAANFSDRLRQRQLSAEAVDAKQINRFVAYRQRIGRRVSDEAAALQEITKLVYGQNPTTLSQPSAGLNDRELAEQEFRNYLVRTRGLSLATHRVYLPVVSQFLNESFAGKPVRFEALTPAHIAVFMRRHIRGFSPSRAQRVVKALRAYLRYLQHIGKICCDLAACVFPVAIWSLATVPAFLRPEQVQCVLEQCPRDTATGRRDYAMLLLLARLGLRAGEIANLTLDDLDWPAGYLTVRNKGGQWTQMPLPHEVGEAMVDYLVNGRPTCVDRRVFIRGHAPRVGFAGSSSVSSRAADALSRAGINFSRQGAHLFRHTLATEMLRQGASLAEIARVLRHQNPDTTRLYAKVDLAALRGLAQPWPGGGL